MKKWFPTLLSVVGVVSASFSADVQTAVLDFASKHWDYFCYILGFYGSVKALLPSPLQVQQAVDAAQKAAEQKPA